jgi:peptide/nickel transport system permease protein|tara:strand:+ start:2184 stop:3134 length:951 start_codon:yes stop_codon:yes gene_type:complete
MVYLPLILKRIFSALITLLIVSALIYGFLEMLPGDVATRMLGRTATPETLANLREQLGLNEPALKRYFLWLYNIFQGDFGTALTSKRPITEILAPKIFNTLILSGCAFILYLPLSFITALLQAYYKNKNIDISLSIITLIILSLPDFIIGTIMIIVFVVVFPIFPAISLVGEYSDLSEWFMALVMPSITLALVMSVYAVRMLRDNLIEVLDSEYIFMAKLKGLSKSTVLIKHALPNAIIPTLNVTALNLGFLIGGVVIVEKIFTFPGFGNLLIDSIKFRDLPLVEATILIAAAFYIFANLLTDILSIIFNPKLRKQ